MRSPDEYRLEASPADLAGHGPEWERVAARSFAAVFRTDLSQPGFCLIDLGRDLAPRDFRALLVTLCQDWQGRCRDDLGRALHFYSLGRFDQKNTTLPHRDGGPDESVLVLGYEPTAVPSRVFLLDHASAAAAQGITPGQLLERFNPMIRGGPDVLGPYRTEVAGFDPDRYRILAIDNSVGEANGLLGVLHQAEVGPHDPTQPRHVNSILLTVAQASVVRTLEARQLEHFIETAETVTG
jgi:hypothetical protein